MSTDFFRRYLDLLTEAETRVKLVANQPVIPGQPLSPVQMATVDFARSMGNQMDPEVDRAYDLAKQAGVNPGPGGRADSTNKQSDEAPSNTRSGQPPADFTPTHFHKNNLGFKIPLMQTPDGKFWWETTATSDDGGPVQKGGARKSIQPWIGDTENRSSGLSGKSSVDGIFKDGEAIEFPEGTTWKEYAAKSRSPQAALPSKVKEIPHIDPGELVAPNAKVDDRSDKPVPRFTNDQALANLAAQMKDAEGAASSLAMPTGSKTDSLESLEILRQVKALAAQVDALPPIDLTKDPDQIYAAIDMDEKIIQQLTSLVKQAAEIRKSGKGMSDITKQQLGDISTSTTNKILARIRSVEDKIGGEGGKTIPMIKSIMERIKAINLDPTVDTFESGPNTDKIMAIVRELKQLPPKDTRTAEEQKQVESLLDELKAVMEDKFKNIPRTKGGAAPSGSASGAASGLDSGARWAYVPGDGTSKDISGKKDSSGLPAAAEIGAGAATSKKTGKETIITDSSHCDQCGTPKSIHAPLKHQFVPGEDVQPGPVGGSQSSSDRSTKPPTDTFDADVAARMAKIPAWDRAKNAPVGAPPKPQRPSSLKEDINRLPVVDQMRTWRQLMEADKPKIAILPGETAAQAVERAQAELNAPKPTPVAQNTIPNKPKRPALLQPKPTVAGAGRFDSPEEIKARAERARNTSRAPAAVPVEVPVDTTAPARPRIRSVTGDVPVDPNFGRPPAPPPNIPPPDSVPPESALGKYGKLGKTAARGFDMFYQIYQGYQQIVKLDYDTMPRVQYWAAVNKIVARLAGDYGLFWVGSILGGLIAGLFTVNPLGAVAGFLAGGTGGLAASYLLGDSVSAITDSIVDSIYGIDKTPAPGAAGPSATPYAGSQMGPGSATPQQNNLTPEYIAKNKVYLENMIAWIASGGIPDEQDKKDMDEVRALLKSAGVTVATAPQAAEKVPAANPVAELVAELRSIETQLDKLYSDQTPLPSKEAYDNEVKKLDRLVSAVSAATEKMSAKVDLNQKLPPELQTIANSVARKIHATQMTLLRRQALSDLDPDAYAKHKAAADKLTDLGSDINYLDVKDPDYLKKMAALTQQTDQIVNNLPSLIAVNTSGARMMRIQALNAVKDAMERKQKEYQDYRAKNPTPAPATSGPKEGEKSTSKNGRPIIFTNGRWEYAN